MRLISNKSFKWETNLDPEYDNNKHEWAVT